MDITPTIPGDLKVIDSYGPGRFQIGGEAYQGPVIVFPNAVYQWPAERFEDLGAEDFSLVKDANPAVDVLLRSGERAEFLRPRLKAEIKALVGITGDAVATGAACRTYNILLAEGRRVAAALFPLP